MTAPHLVLFDADRIKDYVFATGRLKEIRGASEQVRRLTDYHDSYQAPTFKEFALAPWQPGAHEGVIYASGGAGAVLFASQERAADFCAALEQAFRRETAGATLSAVWVPVGESEAAAQREAAKKLARRKASRPLAELIPGGGPIRFCARDRLRPASLRVPDADASLLVSRATANKRLNNLRYRDRANVEQSALWQAFERHLSALGQEQALKPWREAIHPSQDLGTIASQTRPAGYVALVYVDGDGIGKQIASAVDADGFAGYSRFSKALAHAATEATAAALATAYASHPPEEQDDPERPGKRRRFLPFEVITIGGDDVILVCTGEHGVAIASGICERFGLLVADYCAAAGAPLAKPPTASAGVVIAHDSLPIVQLERRGRELLRSAKQRDEGGVDFQIVSTPALAELRTVRAQDYVRLDTGLTARPYSHAQFTKLLSSARKLRRLQIPGSKRADLYQAASAEHIQATLGVLTVQVRMHDKERTALLESLLDMGFGPAYPFQFDQSRKPSYYTALLDLLELMEFVAEEGAWGA